MPRKVVIERQRRLLDDFFKVDEYSVAHQQIDGSIGAAQRRLVFERGDSAAVLLWHAENDAVVLVEQFKLPALIGRGRDAHAAADGWIVETVAGMIDPGETPEAAAIRETLEETGYRIGRLQRIGKFFVSPGGTSERVFLFYAEVHDGERATSGSGIAGEDIRVVQIPIAELLDRLDRGMIEDAKLAIAAYWLRSQRRPIRS